MTPIEISYMLFGAMFGVGIGIGASAFVAWLGRESPRKPKVPR